MKKQKYLQVLVILCSLSLVTGFATIKEPLGNISNISIASQQPNTKVVLESDSPLTLVRSGYAIDRPSTLILDFDRISASAVPQRVPQTSPLVRDMKIEKIEDDQCRLLIDLKERVPYRIQTGDSSTILELNNIQRNSGKYILDKEVERELVKADGRMSYLTRIDVATGRDKVDIKATLDHTAVPNVFVLDNPLRLVVDLYNTYFSASTSAHQINQLGIKKLRAAQFQVSNPHIISRLVFDLTDPVPYSIESTDKSLTISFYKEDTTQAVPAMPVPEPAPSTPPLEEKTEITPPVREEIKTEQAAPKVEKADPKIEQHTTALSVEETTTAKPVMKEEKLELPPAVSPQKNGSSASQASQQQFEPQVISKKELKYSGEVLTLRFKDADLRDVIMYLGDFAGLNVVFDPEVSGRVTCNLVDVPWDQALDVFLKQNKMGRTLEGNVLRIAPVGTLTREREEQLKLDESKELAGPRNTQSYTLSYSKAADVQSLLEGKLSERGEIIVDDRTNTLVITDVADRLELIERLLDVFDTPTPQVSIEARIVEATSTFIRNLGIQWGARGISDPFYGNQTSLQFPHKILLDGAMIPQGIVTKGIGGPLGGYAINLPAPAFTTAVGVSFANVLDTFRIDMAISALETSGQGRIISSPSVTTQNNQEAHIVQGRQIPVQTVANFTVTTRYINAALELRATPQITAEGTIIMNLELQNNAADFANLVNGIPPIITQSASTTVMIPDGGTTVIGGIYRTEDSITRERVPFFHKIPIIGNLFRSFARTKQSRELLIFITPRILR
jgi:type IV pilus secretin PilQ/predicted competence protein